MWAAEHFVSHWGSEIKLNQALLSRKVLQNPQNVPITEIGSLKARITLFAANELKSCLIVVCRHSKHPNYPHKQRGGNRTTKIRPKIEIPQNTIEGLFVI